MKYTVATLGSHSSLQILKGAKDEGFETLVITKKDRKEFYKRYPFIDTIVAINSFSEFPLVEKKLLKQHVIVIPHGSFVAHLGIEGNKKMSLPYFGNKKVLEWEADRELQKQWLHTANIHTPQHFSNIKEAKFPIIVKTFGAAGGEGYFFANSEKDFTQKIKKVKSKKYIIQEYVVGVTAYMHYFYSPLTKQVELLGVDRRYETNADALGRIPLNGQKDLVIEPSYVVVGNTPLVLRESLLPEVYAMGERIVAASKQLIDKKGIFGPFCLETIITSEQKFIAMEISCRIVAGTNIFINSSPYADLLFDVPMSTGRRIAREIKLAMKKNKLNLLLD